MASFAYTTLQLLNGARRSLRPAAALILLFCLVGVLGAQEDDLTEFRDEAPEALLELDVGDAEVDFFVAGSWTSGIGGTFGVAYHPPLGEDAERWTVPYAFPGMEPTPFFNTVDLTLSVWLQNRYFFETSFLDDFEFNTFLVGYQGAEHEFVQSVTGGNAGFPFGTYPFLSVGSTTTPVPGLSASFRTATTEHELVLRLEQTTTEEARFLGTSSVETTRIEPHEYLRGRFFTLPDANVTDLRLFLETPNGDLPGFLPSGEPDGRTYREVDIAEAAVYSLTEGTVFLREPASGRVLVYYTSSGLPVGDSTLGGEAVYAVSPEDGLIDGDTVVDFSFAGHAPIAGSRFVQYTGNSDAEPGDFAITVDGVDALLLYEPGTYSPFEMLSHYPAPANGDARLLYRESNVEKPTNRELEIADGTLTVTAPASSPRLASSRYPFLEEYPALYGPGSLSKEDYTDFVLAIDTVGAEGAFSLGGGIVPGTVEVTRNGRPVESFSIDESSGELEFPFDVEATDQIRIRYRRYASDGPSGELVFGLGNRLAVSGPLSAHLAFGLRWNVAAGQFSVRPGENPGEAVLSAGLEYTGDQLDASVNAGVAAVAVDTTGYYRADGIESIGESVALSDETVFPSATPGGRVSALAGVPIDDPSLRGALLYKDYSTVDAFGNRVRERYDATDIPASNVHEYESDRFVGPYTAGGDEIVSGPTLVLDYLFDGGDVWVGSQVRLGSLDAEARKRTEVLRFRYRGLDIEGPVALVAQIGVLDEDLDGDGVLDAGTAGLLPGFTFDDGDFALTTPYRSRSGSPAQSEDADGDGLLDGERPSLVESYLIDTALTGTTEWRTAEIPIDGPLRSLFAAARSVRFLVVREGNPASAAAGRLVLGELEVGAARTWAGSVPGNSGTVRLEESGDGVLTLHEQFPEVREVFHSDSSVNEVLSVTWSGVSSTDAVVVREYFEPATVGSYRRLSLYADFRESSTDDATARLELSNGIGDSETVELPLSQGWRKVSVDLTDGTVSVDDAVVGQLSSVGVSTPIRAAAIIVSGAESGRLLIDEIHFSDPIPGLGAGAEGTVSYRREGPIVTAFGTPLLADLALDQRLFLRTAQFTPVGVQEIGPGLLRSASAVEATVFGATVRGELDVSASPGYLAGSVDHGVSIPLGGIGTFEDVLSYAIGSSEPRLRQENTVAVSAGRIVRTTLATEATITDSRSVRRWSATASSAPVEALAMDAGARFGQTGDSDEPVPARYVDAFVGRYRLLLPGEAAQGRTGRFEAGLGLTSSPVGATVDGSTGFSARSGRQENTAALNFELPADVAGIRGVLAYQREWTEELERTIASDGFADALEVLGQGLAASPYVLTSPPFYELLRPASEFIQLGADSEALRGSYRPRVSVELSRRIGSQPYNLFLPSAVEASVGRSLARQRDATRLTRDIEITASTAAVNLFGRSAGRPVFSFYESEEISSSALFRVRTSEQTGSRSLSAAATGTARFFGTGRRVFAVRSTGNLELPDASPTTFRGEATLDYRTRAAVPPIIAEPLAEILSDGYIDSRFELEAELSGTGRSVDAIIGRLGFESALTVPERGSVSVEAGVGIGSRVEPDLFADRSVLLLGVYGKIEGRLTL